MSGCARSAAARLSLMYLFQHVQEVRARDHAILACTNPTSKPFSWSLVELSSSFIRNRYVNALAHWQMARPTGRVRERAARAAKTWYKVTVRLLERELRHCTPFVAACHGRATFNLSAPV